MRMFCEEKVGKCAEVRWGAQEPNWAAHNGFKQLGSWAREKVQWVNLEMKQLSSSFCIATRGPGSGIRIEKAHFRAL